MPTEPGSEAARGVAAAEAAMGIGLFLSDDALTRRLEARLALDGTTVVGVGKAGAELSAGFNLQAIGLLVAEGGEDWEETCERVRRLLAGHEDLSILIRLGDVEPVQIRRLLLIGCAGVVDRTQGEAEICQAIRAIRRGELWAPRAVISQILKDDVRHRRHSLTAREADILERVENGFTNRRIAKEMGLSQHTVRWHLRHIHAKIGPHLHGGLPSRTSSRNGPDKITLRGMA